MDLSNLEFLREIDSSSLVDFDYDRNLFEYEQNSVLPVPLLLILLSSVIASLLLVPLAGRF